MSNTVVTRCPRCQQQLQVNESQLRTANRQVRCGECLQVFDAFTGDTVFVAPSLSNDDPEPDFSTLSVAPMSGADLPLETPPAPRLLVVGCLILVLLALAQVAWHMASSGNRTDTAVAVTQLLVRSHPQLDGALQLDSVLLNDTATHQPYPDLLLRFDNRYGESVAARRFGPTDYLPYAPSRDGIAPGTRVQVQLEMLNPGAGTSNYQLLVLAPDPANN